VQEFLNWTVDTIRQDRLISPWLEEKKYEWVPLVSKSIVNLFEKSYSVLVVTDNPRDWFLKYILTNINSLKKNRPFLPFYNFKFFYKDLDSVKTENEMNLIKDMLDISFPNGYFFWYIGKSNDVKAILPKFSKNSFLWILDEEIQDAFNLKSADEALDMKLLQMFRLYDKTLSANLFAQIDVER